MIKKIELLYVKIIILLIILLYMKGFNIIIAVGKTFGIGIQNKECISSFSIPWKINEDIKHFQNITSHTECPTKKNIIIMGLNTWNSIPEQQKPLKNRINIVISTTYKPTNDEVIVFNNFDSAYEYTQNDDLFENIFVIGGKKLIESCIDHVGLKYLFITHIDNDFNCNINIKNIQNYFGEIIWEKKIKLYDELSNNYYDCTFCKYNKIEHPENQYISLLNKILNNGTYRTTRNANTWSIFGEVMEYNMNKHGFPVITTKKIPLRLVFEELKFFLQGDTNALHLAEKNVNIWNANTTREFLDSINLDYPEGTMGPMYGFNLLHYGANYIDSNTNYENMGINQFEYVLNTIKKDPFNRRIMMTTYNPLVVSKSVLWPCHGIVIQFACEDVGNERLLHCNMYQRSCDMICGVPFNISSYAMLVNIMCNMINNDSNYTNKKLNPGTLKMFLGDVHIYDDKTHIDAVILHKQRKPFKLPSMVIKKKFTNINELNWEDIEIINYISHPTIKVKMFA